MISSRLHGVIDYLVSACMALLTREGRFSPGVTRLLRAAPPAYLAYSALTDYELGLVPALSLRQHLALDALSGVGFVAAGALMDRERPDVRAMLVGIGLSELLVVALTDTRGRR